MGHEEIDPPPTELLGLTWRAITRGDDLNTLVELAQACLAVDGGLGFLFVPEVLTELYFPEAVGAVIGAFDAEGRMAACTSVHAATPRAMILGLVRPDWRTRGIGAYLLRWSEAQGRALLAGVDAPHVLQIRTESLTGPADRLYRARGFEPVFEELVMERDLRLPLPESSLPPGVTLVHWQPELAEGFYQAYHAAFRERPGFPGWSAAEWIAHVTENDHRPDWTFLAREGETPLGFVIGNVNLTTDPPGGFVWQIGVIPGQRRRGLASALLVESMRRMRAAGCLSALLTVHTNNPGAIETYSRMGYASVGRRARYERVVE